MKIYNILMIAMALIILVSFQVNAEQTLGDYKQYECVILKQTCANCTFVNVTSVVAKNSSGASIQLLGNVPMTKIGTEYNYTFCSTTNLGEYTYNTLGNPDGILTTQPVSFSITPSGYNQTTSQSLFSLGSLLVLLVITCILFVLAFKFHNDYNYWFYGILALGLGLIFGMYSLTMAVVFANDLAYTTNSGDGFQNIFRTAYTVVKIIVWSIPAIFLLYLYRLWKDRKKNNQKNDGWDNNQYT